MAKSTCSNIRTSLLISVFVFMLQTNGVSLTSLEDPQAFTDAHLDFIVIGGGTAGLAVASRLSEDPTVKVGVIEAGVARTNDPLVDTPVMFGRAVSNPLYDWNLQTVPQAHVADRKMIQPRGKMLGGSSALNFMVYHRASAREYDNWETLGAGKGWNWKGLLPFFKMSEHVKPSLPEQFPGIHQSTATDSNVQGKSGPIEVGFGTFHPDLDGPALEAFETLDLEINTNPLGGHATGAYDCPRSVQHKSGNRSYSATGYYFPHQDRQNLFVITNALASKINFLPKSSESDELKATSVTFTKGGKSYTVSAAKEVILSAGTFQTPQLLELSGIGNATILRDLGIEPLIDNPAVGENLQDHTLIVTSFVMNKEAAMLTSLATLSTNQSFAAEQLELYEKHGKGAYAFTPPLLVFSPLENLASEFEKRTIIQGLEVFFDEHSASMPEFERQQYRLSLDLLKEDKVGQAEFIPVAGILVNPDDPANSDVLFSFYSFGSRLFSHGSVHVSSNDPSVPPDIDPRYFSNPFDKRITMQGVKTLLKLANSKPLNAFIREPVGLSFDATDDDVERYVLKNVGTEFHPIGTASLGPRGNGGVVDENLVVYGTSNVRVVDASVIPAHIAAHIQATVYAIAEKAASIIKEDWPTKAHKMEM